MFGLLWWAVEQVYLIMWQYSSWCYALRLYRFAVLHLSKHVDSSCVHFYGCRGLMLPVCPQALRPKQVGCVSLTMTSPLALQRGEMTSQTSLRSLLSQRRMAATWWRCVCTPSNKHSCSSWFHHCKRFFRWSVDKMTTRCFHEWVEKVSWFTIWLISMFMDVSSGYICKM